MDWSLPPLTKELNLINGKKKNQRRKTKIKNSCLAPKKKIIPLWQIYNQEEIRSRKEKWSKAENRLVQLLKYCVQQTEREMAPKTQTPW